MVGTSSTDRAEAAAGGDVHVPADDRVPFLDLGRGVEAQREEIFGAVKRVIESGQFVLGHEVRAFEQEYAEWLGCEHAVGVASGTDALELALRALDVGPGNEVITQANTCVPTVAAIERAGATPVLCDVDLASGTMDPESLAAAITARTGAVVPVHLYGQCADVDAIAVVAGDIPIVEDCAQAHGARLRGRRAGAMGVCGAFSFYPTKNLGALGDGGMVVTEDGKLAERLRALRQYGQADRYRHEDRGVNSRLDEMQAAILRQRLTLLDAGNKRRAEIAAGYTAVLESGARPLVELADREHVFHLFVCVADDRDSFRQHLAERGVETLIHYPHAIHQQPSYRSLADLSPPLTNSESLARGVVSLPMYPELTAREVDLVVEALRPAERRISQ